MIRRFGHDAVTGDFDVCLIGAGPVGIALALACEARGLSVLLVESGESSPDTRAASLSRGHQVDVRHHAKPDVVMCRGLGGTSQWWGGRCVAFDDVDFVPRPYISNAAWPFPHEEVASRYEEAAAYFGIGHAVFSASAGRDNSRPLSSGLERWAPEVDMGKRHRERLERSQKITVLTGATLAAMVLADGNLDSITLRDGTHTQMLSCRLVVLACGGLETTRLLLAMQQDYPAVAGGIQGALGRYYMGHLSGKIADIVLSNPDAVAEYDFFSDEGVFVRRRFSLPQQVQVDEQLTNVSLWVDNPAFHGAGHRSGVLSLVWLALAIPALGRRLVSEGVRLSHLGSPPYYWGQHALNVLRSPFGTLREVLRIVNARFLHKPAMPGFLVRNRAGRYALHYHAEQRPAADSAVVLAESMDALGMPFLDVKLRFCEADAQAVLRTHKLLDQALREARIGYLAYHHDNDSQRLEQILAMASDGFHQIGTTRMGTDERDSVVDADCKVHGVGNLYVASSAVFPSSGQANPTFFAVALALRLADHLVEKCAPAGMTRSNGDFSPGKKV